MGGTYESTKPGARCMPSVLVNLSETRVRASYKLVMRGMRNWTIVSPQTALTTTISSDGDFGGLIERARSCSTGGRGVVGVVGKGGSSGTACAGGVNGRWNCTAESPDTLDACAERNDWWKISDDKLIATCWRRALRGVLGVSGRGV